MRSLSSSQFPGVGEQASLWNEEPGSTPWVSTNAAGNIGRSTFTNASEQSAAKNRQYAEHMAARKQDVVADRQRLFHERSPRMFMTAREITDQYQVLDGDREERSTYATRTNTLGTKEAYGMRNQGFQTPGGRWAWAQTDRDRNPKIETEASETDEQVYARKYQEAAEGTAEWAEDAGVANAFMVKKAPLTRESYKTWVPDGGTNGSGTWDRWTQTGDTYSTVIRSSGGTTYRAQPLRDSVLQEGVKSPVSLGSPQFVGSQGKPQIVGGHHRLAVMLEHRPDDYMPVLHFASLGDAKNHRGYRYT